jgi:Transposase family tnp2.
MSTDGFAPFCQHKKTCWPLLIYNYNLPPEIHFLYEYILCIDVIPGPNKPKDFDSFFWPAMKELIRLALGVDAFDIAEQMHFSLCAFLILVFSDIPAVSMVMKVKGHNGLLPCCICKIQGLRVPNTCATTYYVPFDRSYHPDIQHDDSAIKKYNPINLPLWTHAEMMDEAHIVQFSGSNADSEHLAEEFEIKDISILAQLPSISFSTSFSYDFMHLIFENMIKNLILLWTGEFKGLDKGCESYKLPKKIWEAISTDTAASSLTIPSAFDMQPPNVADDKSATTAETWSFWMQYIRPILLICKFEKPVYYNHFVSLVKLVRICLQFEMTQDELNKLHTGFAEWVEKYEQYVNCFPAFDVPKLMLKL